MLGSKPAHSPPQNEGEPMKTGISRRQFHTALGWGATSIALSEFGLARRGLAEENFTLASTGATWGEGLRASFVDAPKFEEKTGVKVTQEFAIDSVFTAKAMASCGNPPFSTLGVLQAEANPRAWWLPSELRPRYLYQLQGHHRQRQGTAPRTAEELVRPLRADRDGARLQHERGQ